MIAIPGVGRQVVGVGEVLVFCLMLVGIGFLLVLTATVASRFVKTDTGAESEETMATLTHGRRQRVQTPFCGQSPAVADLLGAGEAGIV
jgi:hypothetical protein